MRNSSFVDMVRYWFCAAYMLVGIYCIQGVTSQDEVVRLEATRNSFTEGTDNFITLTVLSTDEFLASNQDLFLDIAVMGADGETCNGQATESDYSIDSTLMTIPAGSPSADLVLTLVDDDLLEVLECLGVSIQSLSSMTTDYDNNYFDNVPILVEIVDNDVATVRLDALKHNLTENVDSRIIFRAQSNTSVQEGYGSIIAYLSFNAMNVPSCPLVVTLLGIDPERSPLRIDGEDNTGSLLINLLDDNDLEVVECLVATIVDVTWSEGRLDQVTFHDDLVVVRIEDDDNAMVYLEVNQNSVNESTETFFEIVVQTTKPIQDGHGSIMVDIEVGPPGELMGCSQYATSDDYVLENDHIAIPGGSLSATLSVFVVDDDLYEESECFVAFIQSVSWDEGRPDQINFDTSPVVVYITDTDATVSVAVSSTTVGEADGITSVAVGSTNPSISETATPTTVSVAVSSTTVGEAEGITSVAAGSTNPSVSGNATATTVSVAVSSTTVGEANGITSVSVGSTNPSISETTTPTTVSVAVSSTTVGEAEGPTSVAVGSINPSFSETATPTTVSVADSSIRSTLGEADGLTSVAVGSTNPSVSETATATTVPVAGSSIRSTLGEADGITSVAVGSTNPSISKTATVTTVSVADSSITVGEADGITSVAVGLTNPSISETATATSIRLEALEETVTEGVNVSVTLVAYSDHFVESGDIRIGIDLSTTVDQNCILPATASDFTMGTYSLTLLEGSLSTTFSVTVLDDDVPEERECLVASITSLAWGEGRPDQLRIHSNNTVVIPIIDDDVVNECTTALHDCDPITTTCRDTLDYFQCDCLDGFIPGVDPRSCFETPHVRFLNNAIEVLESNGSFLMTLTLSNSFLTEPVTIPLVTEAITATDEVDYEIQTSSVTFPVGSNTASCSIRIFDDDIIEITEMFIISIGDVNIVRVDQTQSTSTVSIIDDDRAFIRMEASQDAITEGATSTITLTALSNATVQNEYGGISINIEVDQTVSQNCFGTVSDSDYEMETQILSIAEGSLSATMSVSVLDDDLVEVQECLIVSIQSVSWTQEGSHEQITFDTRPLIVRINDIDTALVNVDQNEININEGMSVQLGAFSSRQLDGIDIILSLDSSSRFVSTPARIRAGTLSTVITIAALENEVVEGTVNLQTGLEINYEPRGSVTIDDVNQRINLQTTQLTIDIEDNDEALLAFRSARRDISESSGIVSILLYFSKEVSASHLPRGIDIEVQNGDASDSDYEVSTTTIRNLRGNGEDEMLVLRIVNDNLVEMDETFTVSFRSGQEWPRIQIDQSSSSTEISILDDDRDERAVLQVNRTLVEVPESQGSLLVFYWISKPLDVISEFDVVAVSISAELGTDYDFTSTTLTILPGETETSVRVEIVDDEDNEPTEEFRIVITNPSDQLRVGLSEQTTSVVITDDDTQRNGYYVAMARSEVTVREADGMVQIPLLLGSEGNGNVIVRFLIQEGSAKNVFDYDSQSTESIIFPVNRFLEIPIISDSFAEEMESFTVSIESTVPADLQVFNFTTTVHIIDDDTACVSLGTENSLVEEADGELTLLVSLPHVFDKSITVDLASDPVTAQSNDYMQLSRSVVIPANTLSASITFIIVDDTETEEDESFTVSASGVSSPASVCQGISTTTITIRRNDQGPSVIYCPNDITVFTIDPEESVTVKWEEAQFARGQDQIRTFQGLDIREATLRAGSSMAITMTATDVVGRTAICSFDVRVLMQDTADLKEYTINMTVLSTDSDSTQLSRSQLKQWLSTHYRRGNCSQKGYAGLDILTIKPNTGLTEVVYKIYLVMLSECCIQDAVLEFNQLVTSDPADSSIIVDINSHLPDVSYLRGSMRMNVTMGYDASIYQDPNQSQTKLLRNMLITQLTTHLSDTSGFAGICLFRFELGSVLAPFVIESTGRETPRRFEEIEIQYLNVVTTLNVTEGLMAPGGSDASLSRICTDSQCNNQGFCFVRPSKDYMPDCRCDVGYIGDNCEERDFRYCIETDITNEDGLEIKIPSGLRNTILLQSDFRNSPCDAVDYGDQEDVLQIIWAECVDNGGDTVWNYTVNCNATLGEYLAFLLTVPIREDNVVEVSMQLSNASSRLDSDGGADEITQVATLFRNITDSSETLEPSVVDSLATTMSNLVGASIDDSTELEMSGASNAIVQAFEKGLSRVIVDNVTGTYSAQSENIAIMALEVDTPMLEGLGIATVPSNKAGSDDFSFEDIVQVNSSNERQSLEMGASSVFLYPSNIASNLPVETVRVIFAAYRNPVLFSSRYLNEINMDQSLYGRRKRRTVVPNTRVISSSLFSEGHEIKEFNNTNMQDRFRQYYQPLNRVDSFSNFETVTCAFWSFHADGGRGNWSTNGCDFVGIEDGVVRCECDHLTNFAVLMDVYEHDSLTEVQYKILEAVTFFGCAASILGLTVTILAFISQRNLRSKRPNQILICMCCHLLALYITFLVMVVFDSERTSEFLPPLQCGILAGVMHFITVSSLFWMLVEGVNMYFLFVRIVNTHVRNFMLKAVLFADGVPLIIVALTIVITKVIFREDYFRQSVCFVNAPYPVIGGVAVPIGITIIVNVILYVLVICRLSNRVSTSIRSARREKKERRKRMQNALSIMLLMGLTWGFSYFCFIPAGQNFSFAAQLLFSGLNSMQGYLVFMFYCMRNPEFRKRWRHLCFCLCPATFPLQNSLSSRFFSTLSKDKTNSQNKKFRATSVPESSVEQRRRNAFRSGGNESNA